MTSPAYIHELALLTASQWQRSAVRHHIWVRLLHLDGRLFTETGFTAPCRSDRWAWIVETVARETECREDQVGCAEGSEGEDFVTVDGLPVYRLVGC